MNRLEKPQRGRLKACNVAQWPNLETRPPSILESGLSIKAPTVPSHQTMSQLFENQYFTDLVCCGQHITSLHQLVLHRESHKDVMFAAQPKPAKEEKEVIAMREQFQREQHKFPDTPHDVLPDFSSLLPTFGDCHQEYVSMSDVYNSQQDAEYQAPTDEAFFHPVADFTSLLPPPSQYHTPALAHYDESPWNSAPSSPALPMRRIDSHALNARLEAAYDEEQKRWKCPNSFCYKVYKNQNGLKYHLLHGNCELESENPQDGHPVDIKVAHRPFWCKRCGTEKKYKNLNGLKYHWKVAHPHEDFQDIKGMISSPML
jgi:hypothetical protein